MRIAVLGAAGKRISFDAKVIGLTETPRPDGGALVMERFILRENIRRFNEQLEMCTDAGQGAMLEQLLGVEWAKLNRIEGNRRRSAQPSDLASRFERDPLMKLDADLNR